jgi:hypothetical protein
MRSTKKLKWLAPLVLSLAVFWPAASFAKSFEDLLKEAKPVDDLEPILSPFLQECGKSDKVEDLQCRAIRSRMQRKVKQQLYSYVAPAVDVGSYNGTKLNYPIEVVGCLTCDGPAKLKWGIYGGSDEWFVTTGVPTKVSMKKGKPDFSGIELEQHLTRKQDFITVPVGPSETEMWERTTRRNLRVQFVFSVSGKTWKKGKLRGVAVDLKGYRLYNQCKGKVLASVPRSESKAPIVKRPSCRGPVSREVARAAESDEIPEVLSITVIRKVMRSANPAIKECYDTYQIKGLARVQVTVQNDGTVKGAKVKGKFANTPTGKCILDKVRNLIFPAFKKPTINFTYPFYLR